MKHVGKKTKYGIYVKDMTGGETKHWFPSERKRNKALEKYRKVTAVNEMYLTVWKCSD